MAKSLNPGNPLSPSSRKAGARATAKERAEARAKLSTAEKLALLKSRPGESKKERARLVAATK